MGRNENRRRDDRRHSASFGRGAGAHRHDPSTPLRPTGVVLFATLDNGASVTRAVRYGEPRRAGVHDHIGTLPWRHPRNPRLQEIIAWLLGR